MIMITKISSLMMNMIIKLRKECDTTKAVLPYGK